MRIRTAALTVALALVLLAGCSSSDDGGAEPAASDGAASTTAADKPLRTLVGTSWTLATYRPTGGSTTPAAPGASATLTFDAGGQFTMNTGCNQLLGNYTVDGDGLTFNPGPMTRAACADAALTDQESALVELLPEVTGFDGTSATLTLEGNGGKPVLTFDAERAGVENTSWQVTGVNTGNALETTALTEDLSATFLPNGRFSGTTGCNDLTGTYRTSGTAGLTITDLAATEKACADPARMTLEQQYRDALAKVVNYNVTGDVLTLRDSTGAMQVTLTRID